MRDLEIRREKKERGKDGTNRGEEKGGERRK